MVFDINSFHKTSEIICVKVRITIPSDKWIAKYSILYPYLQFQILSLLSISEEQGNCIMQIQGLGIVDFWHEFSDDYDPKNYQLIFMDQHSILLNITIDSPWVLCTIMEPQLIIQFPIILHKNKISIQIVAPQKKIDQIFQLPKWSDLDVVIIFLGKYCLTPALSKRQSMILREALKFGLFDVPRKKSLTEAAQLISNLAKDKSISVSALSENLRRISKKLAKCYIKCVDSL